MCIRDSATTEKIMSVGEEGVSFGSVEEELEYWKDQALQLRNEYERLRTEFEEFQENSQELEAELEASLEQTESKNRDLQAKLQRLEDENDSLKSRLDSQSNEAYVTIATLQAEKADLLQMKDSMIRYIREVEQINDDLERGKRVTVSSLDDFESKLNQAFEKNALLESELDEKEQLSVMCQRLKDEVRDLRSELEIKVKKQTDIGDDELSNKHHSSLLTAHTSMVSVGVSTSPLVKSTPVGTPNKHPAIHQPQPITPSARLSALNMVGDLLRKVGALETRLASCRTNISKETMTMRHNRTGSPISDSPRVKRMHMQKLNGETPPIVPPQPTAGNLTKITV